MFTDKVPKNALAVWVWVAMTAPLAQLAGKDHWVAVIVLALLCGLVCGLAIRFGQPDGGTWFRILQCVWLVAVLAQMARWSADIWPTGRAFPIVPLALLLLAVLSACKGPAAAARVGGILFWFLLLLYGGLLLAGGENVKLKWLTPRWDMPSPVLGAVLLIPAVAGFLPREKGEEKGLIGVVAFAAATALWTVGSLSFGVAQDQSWPFYEGMKSVGLFGVAKRLEAFVSVAATLGYFALCSLLLSAVGMNFERIRQGAGRCGVIAAGAFAASLVWLPLQGGGIQGMISLVLWVLAPLFSACTKLLKKRKKD